MKKIILAAAFVVFVMSVASCAASGTTESGGKTQALLVATSPDYPPYEYYDEQGKLTGFDVEAMDEIVKIMSSQTGTDYQLEWKDMSFETIISAVQTNQADMGVACFTYDAERDVIFSTPYLNSAQIVVVAAGSDINTLDDLKHKKIGAGDGTTGESAAKEIEGADVSAAGDYLIMFETLKNGNLDAVVCDEAVGLNYAKQADYRILDEKLVDESVSVIFKSDNTDLSGKINAAIDEFVKSSKYGELKLKYEIK